MYDLHVQLKTDKAQEIKKLNQQIQMVQSDMSKHREALEDCIRLGYNRRGGAQDSTNFIVLACVLSGGR